MTFRDEDCAFPGNREILERELSRSTEQVLRLAPRPPAGRRTLHELGRDMVLGVQFVKLAEDTEGRLSTPDGVPADIADAYARAKAEVKAILADHAAETAREAIR